MKPGFHNIASIWWWGRRRRELRLNEEEGCRSCTIRRVKYKIKDTVKEKNTRPYRPIWSVLLWVIDVFLWVISEFDEMILLVLKWVCWWWMRASWMKVIVVTLRLSSRPCNISVLTPSTYKGGVLQKYPVTGVRTLHRR